MKKRSILSAALALALLLGLAPAARGGTYKAIQCYERSGAGHADAAYDSSSEHYRTSADCEGKGLGVTHKPGSNRTGSGKFGAWTLTAPDGHRNRPRRRSGRRVQPELPRPPGPDRSRRRSSRSPRRSPRRPPYGRLGGRGRQLLLGPPRLREPPGLRPGKDAYLYMRRIGLTLDDVTAPTLQLGGTLLEPGSRRGDQVLDVTTADTGSGVRSVTVEVNGQPLDTAHARLPGQRRRRDPPASLPRRARPPASISQRQAPSSARARTSCGLLVGLLTRGNRQPRPARPARSASTTRARSHPSRHRPPSPLQGRRRAHDRAKQRNQRQ